MIDYSTKLWGEIQLRWLKGESANQISLSLDGHPSRQAISKKAKKQDWIGVVTVTKRHLTSTIQQLGKDTPLNRLTILYYISRGVPKYIAAGILGIHRNTLRNWEKADPLFKSQCRQARYLFLGRCAKSIDDHAKKNWRAAAWILERSPDSPYRKGDVTISDECMSMITFVSCRELIKQLDDFVPPNMPRLNVINLIEELNDESGNMYDIGIPNHTPALLAHKSVP